MKSSARPSSRQLKGIAALFDDFERKELFRKYLFFLGWVEVLILAICYLYQLGDSGIDYSGTAEPSFPWKTYFLVSFLAPIAITFIIGTVIVGFNNYFGEPGAEGEQPVEGDALGGESDEKEGRIRQLQRMVYWVQKLPFLALLLLLCVAAVFFYKLDDLLSFLASVGEQSVRIFLITAAILLVLASIFVFVLIILNYQLRKRSMSYQYRSEMADRFGLIILDDNTVINKDGKLLVQGRKWKESVPLLTAEPQDSPKQEPETSASGTFRPAVDLKTS